MCVRESAPAKKKQGAQQQNNGTQSLLDRPGSTAISIARHAPMPRVKNGPKHD